MHENCMYYLFVKDVTKIGLIFFEPMFQKKQKNNNFCAKCHTMGLKYDGNSFWVLQGC